MKILLIMFLTITVRSFAQTERGSQLLGGGISAAYYTYDDVRFGDKYKNRYVSISLAPRFGYFVRDGLAVGLTGEATYHRIKNSFLSSRERETRKVAGLGPFVRRYYAMNEKFFMFGQASGRISIGTDKVTGANPSTGRIIQFYTAMTAGFTFFPSPKWGIEATYGNIFYDYNETDYGKDLDGYPQNTKTSTLGASFSMSSFYFGLQYYF